MAATDCAGECGHAGKCIVCQRSSSGKLNGIEICLTHWNEVTARVLAPAKHFLQRVFEANDAE